MLTTVQIDSNTPELLPTGIDIVNCWLQCVDSNGSYSDESTRLVLSYAYRLGNCVHITFMLT